MLSLPQVRPPSAHGRPRTTRAALFIACLALPACGKPPEPIVVVVDKPARPKFDPAKAFPNPNTPRPPVTRAAEPRAIRARAAAIRRTAEAIEAECRTAAAGDWDRWERDTARYRAALQARLDALQAFDPPRGPAPEAQSEPLAGRGDFPLFEVAARSSLECLCRPEALAPFRKERLVVQANRWLRARGVDLIFVPVPRMTEVYVEHFLDPAPPDGVIAPHLRRVLYELLTEDVEVVDGLALFRALRDADPEYLYNPADPHWAPRATRIMAKAVGDRIVRYDFGANARFGLPIVQTAVDRYSVTGSAGDPADPAADQAGWAALTAEQQARARAARPASYSRVTMLDGSDPPDDPKAPVVLIGNSFARHFREQLIKETNLLVATRWHPGGTTEAFAEFLREPAALDGCKVVVWVTSDRHLTAFKPLPKQIAADGPATRPVN